MTDGSTISGLPEKRGELQRENAELSERRAMVATDVRAIDRLLDTFGCRGELDGETPRQARVVPLCCNEFRANLLGELGNADRPLSSRELACLVLQYEGKDARGRRFLADVTRRVGCALRKLRSARFVEGHRDSTGAAVWKLCA